MKPDYQLLAKFMFISGLVVITLLAFTPIEYTPDTGFTDKINHMAAFLFLAALACRIYPGRYLVIISGLMLYGIFIEAVQYWIPGRSCSMLDIAADLCGIAAGICFNACYNYIRKSV